ncbi:MAG: cobalamin-binding protein [Burkholderiales bacterium]|nr:cobalamin-binding protein [Burkholderiales bacterium]
MLAVAVCLAAGAARAAADAGTAPVPAGASPAAPARPAMRIVSLAPNLTELLFAAGAGARVVGVDASSDHPPAARALPRVGSSATLDIERILALRPDLIVAWPHGAARRHAAQLHRLGIPVLTIDPRTIDGIADAIEVLGRRAGTTAQADPAAQALRERARVLAARFAASAPVRVFVQIWDVPLMTISDRHLMADGLRVCAARGILGDDRALTPAPSREAVIAADPALLVMVAEDAQAAAWLRQWQRAPAPRFAAAPRHLAIDPDRFARASPRFLDAVEVLCRWIDAAPRR